MVTEAKVVIITEEEISKEVITLDMKVVLIAVTKIITIEVEEEVDLKEMKIIIKVKKLKLKEIIK